MDKECEKEKKKKYKQNLQSVSMQQTNSKPEG